MTSCETSHDSHHWPRKDAICRYRDLHLESVPLPCILSMVRLTDKKNKKIESHKHNNLCARYILTEHIEFGASALYPDIN